VPAPSSELADASAPREYRCAPRDRALRGLLVLIALLFAAGDAQYHAAFPAYAIGRGA
jgi:hypothetical protein